MERNYSTNLVVRNRAIDERIRYVAPYLKKISSKKRAEKRDLSNSVYPVWNTKEEAKRYNPFGFIYATVTSIPHTTLSDLGFGLGYVNVPVEDFTLARKSFIVDRETTLTPDELDNRRAEHKLLTGTKYWHQHVTGHLV